MRAPAVALDSVVVAEVDGQQLVGRVVGVFQDGQRACMHFRCVRCDYAGKPREGITDSLAAETGYVYLVAHRDSSREFVVREEDLVRGGVLRIGGAPVAVPLERHVKAPAPTKVDDTTPTDRQVVMLQAIAGMPAPPSLDELRSVIKVRSLSHADDVVARLERKGLVERRDGDGRQVVVLTEAGTQWASRKS